MAGLERYDAPEKAEWREWAWRELAKRSAVPVAEARVMYLCGPEPRDVPAALAAGFLRENLIAIDVNPESVMRSRKEGVTAVSATMWDAIHSYPEGWPLNGLLLDYCSGFSREQQLTALTLALFFRIDGGIVVNLQRGRDKIKTWGAGLDPQDHRDKTFGDKNRAGWFIDIAATGRMTSHARLRRDARIGVRASFMSYRSNVVKMDSGAMTQTAKSRAIARRIGESVFLQMETAHMWVNGRISMSLAAASNLDVSLNGRMIAAKAVATRIRCIA